MPKFRIPTQVHIQPGCVQRLPAILRELGCERALFVTDPGLRDQPQTTAIQESLRDSGFDLACFSKVEANPRTSTAEHIAAMARADKREVIIGYGGGSSLDAAKGAALLATNKGRARDFIGQTQFESPPLPFVAIPTTCGTGSEVTWVSVLTDTDGNAGGEDSGIDTGAGTNRDARKISIKGECMFPTVALVDAELLRSLPRSLLASTAIDALTHALEATTGSARNPVSDAMAEKAIALLFAHLPAAYCDGDDRSLEAVMRASTLAGLAFGNADVAAVHCLSETLGGIFDLPHGLCNAILLATTLRAHGASVTPRLAELAAFVDGCVEGQLGGSLMLSEQERAETFLAQLDHLITTVEIPDFNSLGIDPADDLRLARGAVANGSNASNPRSMVEADYLEILESLRSQESRARSPK